LVEEQLMRSEQRAFPVEHQGRFVGIVCLSDIRKIARESWPEAAIGDIMTPASEVTMISPQEDVAETLFTLAHRNVNQLPVIDEGKIRGLIRREDILKWLSVHGEQELERLALKS
jgi:predicted transcriptional regulator